MALTPKLSTCQSCGKRFTPFRSNQTFCSIPCRKRAENVKAGRVKDVRFGKSRELDGALPQKANVDPVSAVLDGLTPALAASGEPMGRADLEWTASNEVTRAIRRIGSPNVIGWAMNVEGHGWFGRIGKDFSFGPTTQARAKSAIEARLLGEPFDKVDDERTWSGTCWRLLSGSEPHTDAVREAA